MVPFMNNKNTVVNFKKCHSFTVTNNIVISNIVENLTCTDHEDADTKIIDPICNIYAQANFVIRCSDTDIAAIMLGNMRHLKNDDYHMWTLTDLGDKQLTAFVSESLQDESEDTKDAAEDNKDIQYQHWIDDKILNLNDNDNEV
ncbi:uncharacterized protein TNCV_3507471 [Trichonephila clavipes]|uniref:Uncharacterized protein n=1 Tax=Trichonephila clavipes TaxID=2585209 RepID=A0A8X6RW10_TRICX|nr:uncharacterized protein TNCV_3507471 [Trichonephila clavipes]